MTLNELMMVKNAFFKYLKGNYPKKSVKYFEPEWTRFLNLISDEAQKELNKVEKENAKK